MVLEDGQPLGGGHLHADAVLLLREACALTVQEELGRGGDKGQLETLPSHSVHGSSQAAAHCAYSQGAKRHFLERSQTQCPWAPASGLWKTKSSIPLPQRESQTPNI